VVAGLSGGLGRYFGVDPVIFRIAFVVTALAGGSGILLYLVGWMLVPDDRGAGLLPRIGKERNQKLLAAVVAGIGVLVLGDQLTSRRSGDLSLGVVLVGIGALVLWSRHRQDDTGGPPFPPPAPPTSPIPPAAGVDDAPRPGGWTGEVPPAPAPRPHSALVTVTLSSLAILAGGLTLFGVSTRTGLAAALLLTGAALLVGAWRGRARWLIPVGLVLATGLAAASLVDVPVRGGSGDVTYHPALLSDVRSPYRLAVGHLVLDLRDLDLGGATLTVVASVAAGDLEIVVPEGIALDVDTHVGAGDLRVLDRVSDGLDLRRPVSEAGREGAGRLVLRARAGVGSVEVRRAAA